MEIIYREALESDAAELLSHIKCVGGETDNLSYGADSFNISAEREALSLVLNDFGKTLELWSIK